jgi:hypothetical protein
MIADSVNRHQSPKQVESRPAPPILEVPSGIHGKRLAAFRETLEVRTRRRVAFNQDVALDSVYNPKSPSRVHETDSPFRRWTFPKKEPEFRLFSVSALQVSSKRQLDEQANS